MGFGIVEKFFPGVKEKMARGTCPVCNKAIGAFRDALSKQEYAISGMCQNCQDSVFGSR